MRAPATPPFACPVCRASLDTDAWRCTSCGTRYACDDGIPILLPPDALEDEYKRRQVEHFDASAAEYEITRPFAGPGFHRWLLEEKFRLAIAGIEAAVRDGDAIVTCGGSGLDAHFLARAGARVLTADLSLGAAKRARERARRFGLDVTAIVADAERLPFADGTFDVAFVHDGLHHLADPREGVRELARVSRAAVSINEPARALVTEVAVRAGLALGREDAGNIVMRLDPEDVVRELERAGFRAVAAERYGMLYRHVPGRPSRALSRRGVIAAARAAVRAANAVVGAYGNKMSVRAMKVTT